MKNLRNRSLPRFGVLRIVTLQIEVLLICAFFFKGCSAYRAERLKNKSYREWKAYQWNQEREYLENGHKWTTFSRKVEGSKFKEFKIVGEISIPPDTAVKFLRERIENGLGYSVYKMPFPFKDRVLCERFSFSVEAKSGIHKICWKEEWDEAPEKQEELIKMSISRGSYEFVPLETNSSLATYILHIDPGGHIPAWMANSRAKKGLPRALEQIEIHSIKTKTKK